VGVEAVSGKFTRGDVVSCVDQSGIELGRGLINYSSEEAEVLRGQPSSEIETILGYIGDDELIHRDNLVMLA
jgi:glutamate 5-kinase